MDDDMSIETTGSNDRDEIAQKYGLPESLHKRITGSTREEMEDDAKELALLLGADLEDTGLDDDEDIHLEGGLSPRSPMDNLSGDPGELARMYGPRRKRR